MRKYILSAVLTVDSLWLIRMAIRPFCKFPELTKDLLFCPGVQGEGLHGQFRRRPSGGKAQPLHSKLPAQLAILLHEERP